MPLPSFSNEKKDLLEEPVEKDLYFSSCQSEKERREKKEVELSWWGKRESILDISELEAGSADSWPAPRSSPAMGWKQR
jgi:hypothetical protein